LGTEIKPIPKVIDPHLYVAEYQSELQYDTATGEVKPVSGTSQTNNTEQQQKDQSKELQQIGQMQKQMVQL
jgi:hypothetical protein